MKVLISGAGVAGLTVAWWLKRYGFTPIIIERVPSLLTGGYKIDIRGSALQVIRKMGIEDTIIAASTDMQGACIIDHDGNVIKQMSSDAYGHRSGDDIEIIRGELCKILKEHINDVECLFGTTIKSIKQLPNTVQVMFQNNQIREFDLLIGADGIHSNVRNLAFGDEERFIRDLGLYLCVYTVPNYLHLDRQEMEYAELGRIAAVWSARNEPDMKACFGFVSPVKINLRDREQQYQTLKSVYTGISWEVPRLLDMMQNAKDYYFDISAQICMRHWSQGRVVLVGDAGYCASPMSGQGTSLALIGAYVLAGELAAAKGDYRIAFAQYENELRSFVNANQKLGLRASKLMQSREKKGVLSWCFAQLMRLAHGRMIEFFLNRATRRITEAANSIKIKDYI